jgi:microcystin-dependent protein
MAEPFLGEIRLFSGNFPPRGWALCDGSLLPINQNQALYSLLGTTYGGNGQTTFALPDLRGRVPVHPGNGVTLGQNSGEEAHTLTEAEMPLHTHTVSGSNSTGTSRNPDGGSWAITGETTLAYNQTPNVGMNRQSLSEAGGSQPHTNMQPYIVLNFCIAIEGIYPSRN